LTCDDELIPSTREIIKDGFKPSFPLTFVPDTDGVTKIVCREIERDYQLDGLDIKPGDTIIDIGAHIGSILSEVLYIDPSIKMIAIEPIPAKVDSLKRRFPSIELHHCALGDFSGEVPFFVNIRESGYSSLSQIASSQVGEIVEITVSLKKLDDLVSSNDVDVIKIDVEGAELNVLRGGIAMLQKNRPTIMFESVLQLDSEFGYTKEELYDFFSSNNYAILIPNRLAHDDPGLSKEAFLEGHLYPRRTTNYFAIPKERRIEIRDRGRNILSIPIN
jgi:FkbM family methyltransferase